MSRDTFADGLAAIATYEWAIGHESEDPTTKQANLERTAVTTGVEFVRQQGAPSPTVLKYAGWIRDPNQLAQMTRYYNACQGKDGPPRTVKFKNLDLGPEEWYEVVITEFAPQRVPGRSGNGLTYLWKYTITMEVLNA